MLVPRAAASRLTALPRSSLKRTENCSIWNHASKHGSVDCCMLYYSMRHRTQLYLDEDQYRWLKQRAANSGSIAGVVRQLIDAERSRSANPDGDPLIHYLL